MPQKPQPIGALSAGGLLYREILAVWPLLLKSNYKKALEEEVKKNSYVGINKEASRGRTLREIRKRFEYTDEEFFNGFENTTASGKKILLFYLCMKTYKVLIELHFEVTIPRWKATGKETENYYYQLKLQELTSKYPEINEWSEKTMEKTITIYKRILRESGLLSNGQFNIPDMDNPFWCYFIKRNELWFPEACLLNNERRTILLKECQ